MAATQARRVTTYPNGRAPILSFVQKAGTIIYKNSLAMHVAGVWQPADSGVSGAVVGGFAEETYDASTDLTDKTHTTAMVFKREAVPMNGKSGDLPTAADLGKLIPVEDDDTVKHTAVSDDVTVRLLEINGTKYIVEPA